MLQDHFQVVHTTGLGQTPHHLFLQKTLWITWKTHIAQTTDGLKVLWKSNLQCWLLGNVVWESRYACCHLLERNWNRAALRDPWLMPGVPGLMWRSKTMPHTHPTPSTFIIILYSWWGSLNKHWYVAVNLTDPKIHWLSSRRLPFLKIRF